MYYEELYGQETQHTNETAPETLERVLNIYKNIGWHHDSSGIVHSHASGCLPYFVINPVPLMTSCQLFMGLKT